MHDGWKGTFLEPYILAMKVVTVVIIMLSIPTALFVGIELFYSGQRTSVLSDVQKGSGS